MRGGQEQLGPYTYRWTEGCFPLGADSLALGSFCTLRPRDRVLDLGCGAGLLLLLCARRTEGLTLAGVELDLRAAEAARENLSANDLSGDIHTGDLRTVSPTGPFDLVISNPPWYPENAGPAGRPGRTESCTFPELCRAAAHALRDKGRFALVHRPERLAELMTALRDTGLEPKRLQFCRHRPDKPPFAVLLEAAKGGRAGLDILPDFT